MVSSWSPVYAQRSLAVAIAADSVSWSSCMFTSCGNCCRFGSSRINPTPSSPRTLWRTNNSVFSLGRALELDTKHNLYADNFQIVRLYILHSLLYATVGWYSGSHDHGWAQQALRPNTSKEKVIRIIKHFHGSFAINK